MTNIFLWVGFVALTGGVALIAGWLWFQAALWWWKAGKEFHWIVAWAMHKKGVKGRYLAYWNLVMAIAETEGGDFYERLMLNITEQRNRVAKEKDQ